MFPIYNEITIFPIYNAKNPNILNIICYGLLVQSIMTSLIQITRYIKFLIIIIYTSLCVNYYKHHFKWHFFYAGIQMQNKVFIFKEINSTTHKNYFNLEVRKT